MLNENDIHNLTGLLYLVSHNVPVILGDKVFDVASQTNRDVDIIVMQAGKVGFIAVEVKNIARPLDVGHVEAICAKFGDMPSIKDFYLVSTSGYTKPARNKAHAHGVICLIMQKGKVPPFPTIDISKIETMRISHHQWLTGPVSFFVPGEDFPEQLDHLVNDSTEVVWQDAATKTTNVKQLVDAVACSLKGWRVPIAPGDYPVEIPIALSDKPHLKIHQKLFSITGVQAKGIIRVTEEDLPLDQSHYLEDEEGKIFAGAAMLEWNGHLTGVCVSDKNKNLISFFLPDTIRKRRPVGVRL